MAANYIPIFYIREAVRLVQRAGYDVGPVLLRLGMDQETMETSKDTITNTQYIEAMLALMRLSNDEFLGIGGHRRAPRGSFGMMCHAIIHLPTLKRAILRGSQYYNQLLGDIHIKLQVRGEKAILSLVLDSPEIDHTHITTETTLTTIHRFVCWLIDRKIPLIEATFAYTAPEHVQHYNRLFHCPLHFNQPKNSIIFSAEYLSYAVMQNETSLRSFLRSAPANLFVLPDNINIITTRIIALLGRDFTREFPDFDKVAEDLHLAPQTLRRKLREEATSYQEIKDNLRRNAAIYYLSRPQLGIGEIAELMGFSEASTFHRAFKKWTGLTPGEYREGLT